jgi:hypothetical protein
LDPIWETSKQFTEFLYKYNPFQLIPTFKNMQEFTVTPSEYLQAIVFDFANIVEYEVSDSAPPADFLAEMALLDNDTLFKFPSSDSPVPTFKPVSPPCSPKEQMMGKKSFYECNECPKVFSRSYALVSHMTKHTSTQPYSCTHCALAGKEIRFKRTWDCKRHEKKCSNRKERRGTF